MKRKSLPAIPLSKIYKALLSSPAGKSLRSNLRYDPFRHHSEDAKHWRKMLGPSAVTYSHMKHVYKLTERAIRHELKLDPKKFSLVEQETLLLAALSHDFGEAILDPKSVGDVPAPLKKRDHEKMERRVFKQVVESLNISPSLKSKLHKSYHEVCHKKNSALFKFFHLIEHIDYLDTALRLHKNLRFAGKRLKRGKHIIGQILTFSIPLLVDNRRNHHLSTRHFIKRRKSEISEMFQFCITEYRRAEKLNRVILGIDIALISWMEYSNS